MFFGVFFPQTVIELKILSIRNLDFYASGLEDLEVPLNSW